MKNPHIKGKRLTPTKETIRKKILGIKPEAPNVSRKDIQPISKTNTPHLRKKAREEYDKKLNKKRAQAERDNVPVDLSPTEVSHFLENTGKKSEDVKKYYKEKKDIREKKKLFKERADIRDAAKGKKTLLQSQVLGKINKLKKEISNLKKDNLTELKGKR